MCRTILEKEKNVLAYRALGGKKRNYKNSEIPNDAQRISERTKERKEISLLTRHRREEAEL